MLVSNKLIDNQPAQFLRKSFYLFYFICPRRMETLGESRVQGCETFGVADRFVQSASHSAGRNIDLLSAAQRGVRGVWLGETQKNEFGSQGRSYAFTAERKVMFMKGENERRLSKRQMRALNWFVLYVSKFQEREIAERLMELLDEEIYYAFVPTKDYITVNKGREWKRRIPVFNNYVFLVGDVSEGTCFEAVKPIVNKEPNIFRLLTNDEEFGSIAVCDDDKALLMALFDDEFNIPAIEAIVVGDRVVVTATAFEGFEGHIKRIDKHARLAEIEFCIFGKRFREKFSLEIVELDD